jgi:MFS family permease
MMEFLAAFFTGLPVLVGAVLGARSGGRRLLAAGATLLAMWLAGIAAALAAVKGGWYEPAGLVTPVLIGLAAAVLARAVIRRATAGEGKPRAPSIAGRGAGALFGAASGFAVAVSVWLLLFLFCAVAAAPPAADPQRSNREPSGLARAGNVFQALVQTANRGFVRHLPVIGPLEEEVEALAYILRADPRVRAELARQARWDGLSELPSLQAIVDDRATMADIDRVGRGNLAALYRLQKNPLIIAFCREAPVQKLLRETRPTLLAKELAAIEARQRERRSEREGH